MYRPIRSIITKRIVEFRKLTPAGETELLHLRRTKAAEIIIFIQEALRYGKGHWKLPTSSDRIFVAGGFTRNRGSTKPNI